MKKGITLILLICSTYFAIAQQESEFQIRAGLGWAIYGARSEVILKTPSGDVSSSNKDGAATLHLPLEIRYGFNEDINVGLDFKFGSYVYDPDSSEGKSNRFVVIGIAGEYSIVAKEHLRWYVGLGINGSSLVLEENDKTKNTKEIWTYSGGGFRLNTGLLIFLSDHVGLNFNLGYDGHNFKLKEYELNGQKLDLTNLEGTLKVGGVDGTLGLFVRF